MSTDQLREASTVLQQGDKKTARLILKEVLNKNPKSERGWLLLAKTANQPSKIRFCLQQVLRINPENKEARNWLEELRGGAQRQTAAPNPVQDAVPPRPTPNLETRDLIQTERDSLDLTEPPKTENDELSEAEWEAIQPTFHTRIGEIFNDFDEEVEDPEVDLAPPSTGWTWRCNPEGVYIAVSPSVFQILGYKPQEFYGQTLATFGLTFKSQIALEMTLQKGRLPTELSVEFRSAYDEIVPVNLHILPYTNDKDVREGLHGFTEVIQDLANELPGARPEDEQNLSVQVDKPDLHIPELVQEVKPRIPIETKILSTPIESEGFGMFMRATPPEEIYTPELPKEDTPTYCPFVGLHEDRRSRTAFPSPSNFCYGVERPRRIKVSYQANFCLGKGYIDCKVYQAYIANVREPTKPVPQIPRRKRGTRTSTVILVLTTIVGFTMIVLLIAYFLYMSFLV